MEVNRKECAKYLKDLPYCFAPETFVGKDTTITAIKTDVKVEPEIKIEAEEDSFSNSWSNDKPIDTSSSDQSIANYHLEQMVVEVSSSFQ